jgi:hypothetical protein
MCWGRFRERAQPVTNTCRSSWQHSRQELRRYQTKLETPHRFTLERTLSLSKGTLRPFGKLRNRLRVRLSLRHVYDRLVVSPSAQRSRADFHRDSGCAT